MQVRSLLHLPVGEALWGVRSWWRMSCKGRGGGRGQGEQTGWGFCLPSLQEALSTLEWHGAWVRKGREKGLLFHEHLYTRSVPVDPVHRLPATLGITTLAGWGLAGRIYLWLGLITYTWHGNMTKEGKLFVGKMSLLSQLHRPLTFLTRSLNFSRFLTFLLSGPLRGLIVAMPPGAPN